MRSIFSSSKSSSRSNQRRTSSVHDGRMSFSSDTSTLLNVDLPSYYPTSLAPPPKYIAVLEEDMLDPEDRAWGPPPSSGISMKWLKMSRKTKSRS